jgi:quercetin dioxygenase-like cupin family protein
MGAGAAGTTVTSWPGEGPASEAAIRRTLEAAGLDYYPWSNGPGDVYAAHAHAYNKVIYVARGSITFGLPATGERLTLRAGDRLDLPAGVVHDAVVGDAGVLCYEAHC